MPLQPPMRGSLPTPDGDDLYFDWYVPPQAKALAVLCHGLEGHSRRQYMLGMANALFARSFEVFAWNYRSCGGQMNKQLRFYHSGATDDLATVLSYIQARSSLPIVLVGFSLGGNLALRYLGELGQQLSSRLKAAAAISVPMDLAAGADYLARPAAQWYTRHFLKSLRQKVMLKANSFPQQINLAQLNKLRTLRDFDEHYTGPLHGYAGADDYYARASSLFVLQNIQRPVLLLQAKNDPFLPKSCFPKSANPMIKSCFTPEGGHVGFLQAGSSQSFAEQQVADFFDKLCITC